MNRTKHLRLESLEARELFAIVDNVLHTFAGPPADGAAPLGQPTLVGNLLFGTTSTGGTNDLGTLFSINRDGSDFTVLHNFAGGAGDGSQPQFGSLAFDGTRLYGTTIAGGGADLGTIFSYDSSQPPATAFSVLYAFSGGVADGSMPRGGLTLDGTTLYGVTTAGGAMNQGTLFQFDSSGAPAAFQVLASFGGALGEDPIGAPTLLNNHLYGTATTGGAGGLGTIYDYDITAATFTTLRAFAGGAADGASPEHGKLAAIGSLIFGTTSAGGASNLGTLYQYDTTQPAATAFSILHAFSGTATDGSKPLGSPALAGTQLFGTTAEGGATNNGAVFSFDTASAVYRLRYSFAGSPTDGSRPTDGVALLEQPGRVTLYGTTSQGGVPAGFGTVYSVQVPVADPATIFVTSADWQGKPQVTVYNADGSRRFRFMAYDSRFVGGVRVAVGDINADGTPDIVTAPGPGPRQPIKVFSGVDASLIAKFFAGSRSFSGGYHLAVGNFDADARQEIVVGFGSGGTSAVQTFNVDAAGVTVLPGLLGLFYPYTSRYKGGVQLAAANIDGVGLDELVVAPGYNGGSLVKVYSAAGALVNSFVAYTAPFTGGLFVAAGDLDGDGKAEIVTGPAQTNLSLVRVFNGQTGVKQAEANIHGKSFRGGVRVTIVDRDRDGIGEVATAPGILGNQDVRFLKGDTLAAVDNFFAGYPGPRNVRGVFVAGSRSF